MVDNLPSPIVDFIGHKQDYACVKCGNKEDFQITIIPDYLFCTGQWEFWSEHNRVISQTYILLCKRCNYKITVFKEC